MRTRTHLAEDCGRIEPSRGEKGERAGRKIDAGSKEGKERKKAEGGKDLDQQ